MGDPRWTTGFWVAIGLATFAAVGAIAVLVADARAPLGEDGRPRGSKAALALILVLLALFLGCCAGLQWLAAGF